MSAGAIVGAKVERNDSGTTPVRKLTDEDYVMMRAWFPGELALTADVWAAFLTKLLGRTVVVGDVDALLAEFNARGLA